VSVIPPGVGRVGHAGSRETTMARQSVSRASIHNSARLITRPRPTNRRTVLERYARAPFPMMLAYYTFRGSSSSPLHSLPQASRSGENIGGGNPSGGRKQGYETPSGDRELSEQASQTRGAGRRRWRPRQG